MVPKSSLLLFLFVLPSQSAAVTLQSVMSAWSLTSAAYNFSVPTAAMDSNASSSYILANWEVDGINGDRLDFGDDDLVFSPDPSTSTSALVRRRGNSTTTSTTTTASTSTKSSTSPSSSSASSVSQTSPSATDLAGKPPVLRVEFPEGSYSKSTGGAQWTSLPFNGGESDGYERMLLSYDVWFPAGYAFNQGGKLPGLRGGPDPKGCSGGSQTDGTGCFSTRLMWRSGGEGEVYAYIPTTMKNFCDGTDITCNSDYGTSLARGSFTFVTGQWQTVWLLVVLNDMGTANGVVQLWYNGVNALSFTNLELRATNNISSVGGLFFSTFFGGNDATWATPVTQYTYFRNMQLYAGDGASNSSGSTISSKIGSAARGAEVGWALLAGLALGVVGAVVGLL